MKFFKILLFFALSLQASIGLAESFITAPKSDEITIGSYKAFNSSEGSILRINYESVFEIYHSTDDKLKKFFKRGKVDKISIQTHDNEIEWHALEETDIKLKKKGHYLRVYFPMQTFKLREAAKNGEKLLIGFKKGSQEITRSYLLEVDCEEC